METIDALGLKCPTPLILTKRLLDTLAEGTVCTMVDDEVAVSNLMDYASSQGFEVRYEDKGGQWHIFTTKTRGAVVAVLPQEGLAVLVTSQCLGQGDEGLARHLMQQSLESLAAVENRPSTLIFMNGGIFWNTENSPVEGMLYTFEADGVDIITCGACLDFYGVKEQLLVGRVGNMFSIVEKMSKAKKTFHLQ